MAYRIEPGEERVEVRRRLENRVEGARGEEAQVERRRRRRNHEERVFHEHEENETHSEQTRYPMVCGHVDSIGHGPFHEGGVGVVRGRGFGHGAVNTVSWSAMVFAPALDGGITGAVHDRWR